MKPEKELNDMTLREIYAQYYSYVRSIAEDTASEYSLTCSEDYQNNEDAREYLEQSCDGSQWVIYTYRARIVAVTSENVSAYEDVGIENPTPEQIAFFAMVEDVQELLNNDYFWEDINKKVAV